MTARLDSERRCPRAETFPPSPLQGTWSLRIPLWVRKKENLVSVLTLRGFQNFSPRGPLKACLSLQILKLRSALFK